jgi:NAD dependent epimerase/dehydratase family enzyme
VTAPEPLDQASFARVLGEVLGRPSLLPLPATAVRLALGERGERLLLEGAIVTPARLVAAGHRFTYPSLAGALRHLLGLPA